MKNWFIIFCFLLLGKFSFSQGVFQKIVTANADMGFISCATTTDSGYVFVGWVGSYTLLMKTDVDFNFLWDRTFGEGNQSQGFNVQQTTDGGYVITGSGSSGIYLLKTNADGELMWLKSYGPGAGYCVKQTSDGGYIIAGKGTACTGNTDIYLIKTDASGDTLWTRTFGGDVVNGGWSVVETNDGGFIVAGHKWSWVTWEDIFVVRTDINGDTLWTRTYGGTDMDGGSCIIPTIDSCFVLTGYTRSFGNGGIDIFLMKINDSGDTLWAKTYSGGYAGDLAYDVKQTQDGGFIISGRTNKFGWLNGSNDILLIKTNSEGDTLWTKVYGRPGDDICRTVAETQDGGFILADYYESANYEGYIVKTDSLGNTGCSQYQFNTTIEVGNAYFTISSGSNVCSGLTISNPTTTEGNLTLYIEDACDTTTYINEQNDIGAGVIVYPNPGQFTISGIAQYPAQLTLFDLTGRVVKQAAIENKQQTIDVSHLPKGLYVWHLLAGKAGLGTARGKIIIQ